MGARSWPHIRQPKWSVVRGTKRKLTNKTTSNTIILLLIYPTAILALDRAEKSQSSQNNFVQVVLKVSHKI